MKKLWQAYKKRFFPFYLFLIFVVPIGVSFVPWISQIFDDALSNGSELWSILQTYGIFLGFSAGILGIVFGMNTPSHLTKDSFSEGRLYFGYDAILLVFFFWVVFLGSVIYNNNAGTLESCAKFVVTYGVLMTFVMNGLIAWNFFLILGERK